MAKRTGRDLGEEQAFATPIDPGLTKRELMASMALSGALLAHDPDQDVGKIAKLAVQAADCLLAELAKTAPDQ
jgi:hypothetical protein